MSDPRSLRVQVRFKNANLLRAIESEFAHLAGRNGGLMRGAAKVMEVGYDTLAQYIRLTKNPWHRDGTLAPSALQIASRLSLDPVEAFPPELYRGHFHPRAKDIEPVQFLSLGSKQLRLLEDHDADPERVAIEDQSREEVQHVLHEALMRLSPREQKILELRYGFEGICGDGVPHKHMDIAQELMSTPGAVSAAEREALKRLRTILSRGPLKIAIEKAMKEAQA